MDFFLQYRNISFDLVEVVARSNWNLGKKYYLLASAIKWFGPSRIRR